MQNNPWQKWRTRFVPKPWQLLKSRSVKDKTHHTHARTHTVRIILMLYVGDPSNVTARHIFSSPSDRSNTMLCRFINADQSCAHRFIDMNTHLLAQRRNPFTRYPQAHRQNMYRHVCNLCRICLGLCCFELFHRSSIESNRMACHDLLYYEMQCAYI